MFGMLLTERAIFRYSHSVGVVALIFIAVIISALTNGALKSDFSPR